MRVPNAEVAGRRRSLERRAKTDGRRRRGVRAFGEAQGRKIALDQKKARQANIYMQERKKKYVFLGTSQKLQAGGPGASAA